MSHKVASCLLLLSLTLGGCVTQPSPPDISPEKKADKEKGEQSENYEKVDLGYKAYYSYSYQKEKQERKESPIVRYRDKQMNQVEENRAIPPLKPETERVSDYRQTGPGYVASTYATPEARRRLAVPFQSRNGG